MYIRRELYSRNTVMCLEKDNGMTVTYSDKNFVFLLFRWRGSVWKAITVEYSIWLAVYFTINACYRYVMYPYQQVIFEKLVSDFNTWEGSIPLTFLIGFFVRTIFSRWWDQLMYVAWPDKLLLMITGHMQGTDHDTRVIRRTFARHCNLLTVLVWKEISLKTKKRFPSDGHLFKAGLMTEAEFELYQSTTGKYGKWFVPVSWMVNLLARCREEGRIGESTHHKLLEEVYAFRASSAMLTMYDWINIPLVYTQVVTVGLYGYFLLSLIGRQSLLTHDPITLSDSGRRTDIVFPLFTTVEFIFYMGWMKVGENLRCPFGEDDEDFELNFVLDRNICVSSMLVDELHNQRPDLEKDKFWDDRDPMLPHTNASYGVRDSIPNWRLHKYSVTPAQMEFYSLEPGQGLLRKRADETKKLLAKENDV